jgi:heme/copper-type cytochrome/quinol oxidase subunit 2
MISKAAVTVVATAIVLLVGSPAYASTNPPEPSGDNSPWVAVVSFLVVVAVAGGMLLIANAYRKNNQR